MHALQKFPLHCYEHISSVILEFVRTTSKVNKFIILFIRLLKERRNREVSIDL